MELLQAIVREISKITAKFATFNAMINTDHLLPTQLITNAVKTGCGIPQTELYIVNVRNDYNKDYNSK